MLLRRLKERASVEYPPGEERRTDNALPHPSLALVLFASELWKLAQGLPAHLPGLFESLYRAGGFGKLQNPSHTPAIV